MNRRASVRCRQTQARGGGYAVKSVGVLVVTFTLLLTTAPIGSSCGTREPAATTTSEAATYDQIWIIGTKLEELTAENVLTFTATIDQAGTYEAVLEAQGSIAQDYVLTLEMEPESGGAAQQARFSFAGLDCG